MIVIERPRGWRGFGWVIGPLWRGVGLQHIRGLYGSPVNRWSIKRTPNDTKLSRRSTGGVPRPLGKTRSIPRTFNTRSRKETRGVHRCMWECQIVKGTIERTGRTQTDASFEKHADEMQMMTWQNATLKQMTRQGRRITSRHLAHRIRGVTTLLH